MGAKMFGVYGKNEIHWLAAYICGKIYDRVGACALGLTGLLPDPISFSFLPFAGYFL